MTRNLLLDLFSFFVVLAFILMLACKVTPKLAAPSETLAASGSVTLPPPERNPFDNVVFNGCYDGDTCNITLPDLPEVFGKKLGLRIWGIDTPEIRGRCAREREKALEARDFVRKVLADSEHIEFSKIQRGKYFRVVARLKIDGRYLDDLLVRARLAVRYYGGTKTKNWCQ